MEKKEEKVRLGSIGGIIAPFTDTFMYPKTLFFLFRCLLQAGLGPFLHRIPEGRGGYLGFRVIETLRAKRP